MVQKKKIGDIELKVISGLLTIIIGLISYFGVQTIDRLHENTKALQELKISITEVNNKATHNTELISKTTIQTDENTDKLVDHEGRLIKLEIKSK